MFKTLKRYTSAIASTTMVLGLLAFVPSTFAASLSLNPQPQATFNITTQDTMNFAVKMNGYDKDYGVGFSIRGPLGENNEKFKLIEFHNYTGNDTYNFKWDGKIDNVDVIPGKYRAEFSNIGLNPNPLTYDFNVVTAEPKINYTTSAPTEYIVGSGEYKVSVDLSGYASETTVKATVILADNNIYIPQAEHIFKSNGTHEFSWDVSNYQPGTYKVKISGEDANGNPTTELAYDLVVKNQGLTPEIEFVSSADNEYVMDSGDYEVSVRLNKYTSNTFVELSLENPSNGLFIPKDNFTFTSKDQTHVFTLTEADLEDFGYEVGDTVKFQLTGKDQANVATKTLADDFKIIADDNGLCAGYKDVKATAKGCDALKWAKDEGIMTGNPDGTFEPNDIFQRDESAKVSLEAFDLYNKNSDYCNNKNPFPDVDEDDWSGNYICRGVAIDMITGYKSGADIGLFKPARGVNLIEMFALILRNVDDSMPKGSSYNNSFATDQWYSGYAKYAYDNDLYPDTNGLLPTHAVTRLEIAMFLYELHKDGEL